ncbi:MAG: tetratricopeptide repeat protein [bacterium]
MIRPALVLVLLAVLAAPSARAATAPSTAKVTPGVVTDSLAILERMVAKDSTKADVLYRLGVMYLDREKNAEAAQVFARGIKARPKDVKMLVNLGIALDNLSRSEEAQDFYRQAMTAAPNDSIASCRLATSLYAQGKFAESMDLLRTIIAKQPRAHCAFFTMGVAFADAGLYRDAIRMWKRVVEFAPASPEATSAKESIEVLERFLAGK